MRNMNEKRYNLFLDDQRKPSDVTWIELPLVAWEIVRDYDDFVELIKMNGVPQIISFDHDLAEEHYEEYHNAITFGVIDYSKFKIKSGYDCARWLAEHCFDNKIPIPMFYIHTLNPVGKKNILNLLMFTKKSM